MTRRFAATCLWVAVATALAISGALASRPMAAQAPAADQRLTDALDKGEASLKAGKWEDAFRAFKQANDLAGKASVAALFGLARVYHGLGDYKNEAARCLDALKILGPDRVMEGQLRNQRGIALYLLAEKNTDKALKDAEIEFRAGLQLPGADANTRYYLGMTILRQGGRDAEGAEHLQAAVANGLASPHLDLARRAIDNPRRAGESFAPPFSLTTRDGRFLTNKELAGRTVLLDFWGTWCPPCRAATPGLVKLYQEFAGPSFEMIGISSDEPRDQAKWMKYVDEHHMLWPQYLEIRGTVILPFNVDAYPTFVVIDPDGIIRLRVKGYSSGSTMRQLEEAIQKSLAHSR
jgi:thiol-disulfide isomerase/thioredoxin